MQIVSFSANRALGPSPFYGMHFQGNLAVCDIAGLCWLLLAPLLPVRNRASLCCLHRHPTHQQGLDLARGDPAWEIRFYSVAMLEQIHLLAAVTVLGVLEQAYFFLQVIHARRTFGVSPPNISGPPEFERIFRAQVNSSEYFPIFVALLWQAGLFFHQGLAAALGLLYLYSRYCYFTGYRASSSDRLTPIYFSTGVLWVLVAAATLGLLHFFLSHYVGLNVLRLLAA